jgi:hypothetical protein
LFTFLQCVVPLLIIFKMRCPFSLGCIFRVTEKLIDLKNAMKKWTAKSHVQMILIIFRKGWSAWHRRPWRET